MRKLKLFLTLLTLMCFGIGQMWGVEIYKNEGANGTAGGITVSGNVNTTSSNGNPGNSLANTSASNKTFTFTGFSVSGYGALKLSIDAAFKSFPSTTNTYPYATVTFYKNNAVVKTDNTTIKWTSKVNTYSTKTIENIPDFDKIEIVGSPAIGKTGKGADATNYGLYMDNITLTGCPNPTSLTNGTITSSIAQLSWSDADDVGSYEVYRSTTNTAPAANATPTTTVTTKSVTFESLNENTTYYWWVRTKCSNTEKSAWVAGTSFTTPAASSCSSEITITKGTPSNGSFTMTPNGGNICIDDENASVTISNIEPSSGYRFKEITSSGGGTINNNAKTVTDISANTTINVVFEQIPPFIVSFVTGTGNTAQADITEASSQSGITLPAGPSTIKCASDGWEFAGWSATNVESETATAPTILATGSKYYPTDDCTLYAVYRKISVAANASSVTYTLTGNWTTNNGNWTKVDGSDLSSTLASGKYGLDDGSSTAVSPVSVTDISEIKFTGTKSNSGAGSVAFYYGSGNSWTLIESKDFGTSLTWSPSSTVTGQLKCVFTRSGGNIYIASIKVTGKFPSYTYISSPDCCTELGTISGAVTLSQLTNGDDKGKLQATWSMASKTGLADNGIKINIYKVGTATAVHTSNALSKDATSYTWATAPDKCTEYYATLTTIKANNTYCEGEEQGQSENITTAGYTITYNLTDDHVTKKSGDAPTSSCDGDIDAYYEAVSGYVLPSSVTVTNAGDEDENWTWNSSTGELTILAEGITGDVAVTITATVAPCDPMSNPSVTVEKTYNGATLSWSAISHAAKYKVYIYNNDDSDLESNENVTGTSYTVSSTLTGLTTYKYRVDAVSENESSYCSSYATGSFTTPDYPTVKLYYSENGTVSAGVDQKILTDFTLPNTAAECNKTFIGWTTNGSFAGGNAEPDPFMEKNTKWQIPTNEKCTLYAVYADVTEASTSWTRVTAVKTLTDGGTFIMGYEATANSGIIIPMQNTGTLTTSTAGYIYSGTGTNGSDNTGTLDMSETVASSSKYEITIVASEEVDGAINIKFGSNFLGNENTKNNAKLYNADAATTAFTPTVGDNDAFTLDIAANTSGSAYRYLKYNTGSPRFAVYSTAPEQIVFYKKNVVEASTKNYSLTCMGKVAKPSITGVTGGQTYEEDQTVTITSATTGATIKYTIDGSDPANSETTMASGSSFTLSTNGTYTIRAIAVKTDMTNSDEATPISNVTIDKPYTTIASFIAAAPTNKKLVLTGAKVLGVTTNYIYIQDATAGIQLNKSSHGITWASGKTLSGYVVGTYSNNNSSAYMPRLTFTDGSTMSVTEDAAALPTATVITAGSEENICKLVKLQNVKFQSTSLSSSTVYVQKSDLDIDTVYNTFGVLNETLPNSVTSCDVTGVLIKYSGKYEIAPVSVDGISTKGAKAILPTLSPAGSTNSGSPTGVEVNEEITVTPAAGMTSTIKEDDETPADLNSATEVTIDADKSITVTASAYYYDDNSATYYYHPDPSLTKYAIGKSAMTNGGVTVKNGDDVVTQAVSGATITLLVAPTTHYHMTGISVKDADQGTVTLTEETAGEEYTFTMPAKAVTVSATFAEDAYATVAFAKGNESATGSAPSSISKRYVGQTATMPANTFALAAHDFAGWKYGENTYNTGASYTILAEDAAIGGKTITFDAQWTPWPDEATIYSSNISTTNADSKVIPEDEEEYDAWKIAKGSSITLTIPAGTTTIYGHLVAWNKESANVTISGSCFSSSKVLTPAADGGIANSSPFTLEEVGSTYYFKLTPDVAITENVNITFTTASDKRAVVFGVNAIYPKITLSPTTFDFENVRANQQKQQVFTITANENVSGALSATITDDANGKYSVSAIDNNQVTVTFAPGTAESGTFTAKLRVAATNAAVTADLTGTAMAAEAPEIVVDKNTVAFGQVDPNAEVSEAIAVELLHIDGAVGAALSGDDVAKFSLSTNSLSENGNIVITPVTTENGIFSATLTLSATGATNVVIPLSITVANKWAVMYTSNVTVTAQENKKVKVGSSATEYNAYKKGNSTNPEHKATIHLPMGTQKLHLHMVAWKSEGGDVTLSGDCFSDDITINVPANDVVSGTTGTYTFADNLALSYYHEIAIDNEIASGGTDVTISKSGSRIVLFGVNQEGGTYEITENTNASTLPDNADVILDNGATLTINEEKTLGDLTVQSGATVIVNNEMSADSIVVEDGGKVTLSADVNADVFHIAASKTEGEANSSGQVIVNAQNLHISGEAYFDYTLDPSGTATYGYYAFCVPFPVNSSTGIYTISNVKLYDGTDYVLYSYHGEIRATGNYGWKRFNGTLTPGVFYLISLYADANNKCAHNTIRFKMEAQPEGYDCRGAGAKIHYNQYAQTSGNANDAGWNGVGNPTVQYVKADVDNTSTKYNNTLQVYNHGANAFGEAEAGVNAFTVGSPFFIQAATEDSLSFTDGSNASSNILAPARVNAQTIERICVSFGNEVYTDRMYIAASEDALNSYELCRDLSKMSIGTARVAQISSYNYGLNLMVEYAPLTNNQATYQLNLFAPAAGTYSLSAQEVEGATLYVTYNGAIVWNLSLGDYEIDLARGTTTGYGLMLVAQPNQMPTGVDTSEGVGGDAVQKILLNGQLYILRDGKMFDAVGKEVK